MTDAQDLNLSRAVDQAMRDVQRQFGLSRRDTLERFRCASESAIEEMEAKAYRDALAQEGAEA